MLTLLNHCIMVYALASSITIFTMNTPLTVREITVVKKPFLAGFLQHKNAVIADNICYHIVDIDKNEIIGKIEETPLKFITNKKRNLIGIQTRNKFLVYDTDKKTRTWQLEKDTLLSSSTFTANDTFWAVQKDTLLNSHNKKYKIPGEEELILYACSHATKEQIFYTKEKSKQESYLCRLNLGADKVTVTTRELPARVPGNSTDNQPHAKKHSSRGNILALYWQFDLNWSLYDHEKRQEIRTLPECNNLALHPTKSIVGMITAKGFLQVYNFKKNHILAQVDMKIMPYDHMTALNESTMDFSLDGNHLIFMLRDKCYVADITPIVFN